MKYFRLFMLLLILRPCPACFASAVVAEIAPTEAVTSFSANVAQDDCKCPHEHDHESQNTPDQPKCPCCSPDFSPATLTPPVGPSPSESDIGMFEAAHEVDAAQPTIARNAEKTRRSFRDRDATSLPLRI